MVTVSLRSHEVAQLSEMLPLLREMYDEQYYDEGVETVDSIIFSLDVDKQELDCSVEEWKTLMMGLTSGYVTEEQGGMGVLRPDWLTKKLAMRLDEQNAFDKDQ